MPDFLILGAARSGTTSLHYYLDQHPGIAMSSIKEPNFFAFRQTDEGAVPLFGDDGRIVAKSVRDPERYQKLFREGPEVAARGEASPLYLYTPESAELIAATLPEVRTVAVLRDPIDRAYSHFVYTYDGEPDAVHDAFRRNAEEEMALGDVYTPYRTGTHFLRMGRYADQVRRYHRALGPERLHLIRFDDLNEQPLPTLQTLAGYLGVDATFPFDVATVYNRSGIASRSSLRALRTALTRAQPYVKAVLPARIGGAAGKLRAKTAKPGARTELPADIRGRLLDYFADDIDDLERLTGWDLSSWRQVT